MIGRFFGSRFGNTAAPAPGITEPELPAEEYERRETVASLDQLRADIRKAGVSLPPLVSSQVRQIEDVLRPLLGHIGEHGASTEQRVLLNAIITNYLPTPLSAYASVSARERTDNSEATVLLVEQLTTLEGIARDLENQIRTGAIAELSTHGRFLEDKFAPSTLQLGEH